MRRRASVRRVTRVPARALVAALVGVALLPAAARAADPATTRADAPVRYGRDIRPLLSDRCFACHGADPSGRRADLRLDERELATADRGGYAALVPGDVEASEVWARLTSDDPDFVMPPPSANKRPLADHERAALARWIEDGATYESHWAFEAPRRPPPPDVRDTAWARNPIDTFVRAGLEQLGVEPSPDADGATWLRRVTLDLTGLPPTLAELDAYLAADDEAAAREAALDRLFGEEPFRTRLAERLATPWLDAARYADTIGIHTDNGRQLWPYRDWVLRALRDNMPYDAFVTEQLAGDLLPDASVAQRVATGFQRAHVITDEGGAIDEEYLVEYAVDRVNTAGTVFLGLTLGCARCHDHKYDPISQAEYYSLFAFFNNNDEPGLYSQQPDPDRAHEPFLEVPSAEQRAELDELDARVARLEARMAEPLPGEVEKRAAFVDDVARRTGVRWSRPQVLDARSTDPGVTLALQDDGALLAEGGMPANEDHVLELRSDQAGLRAVLLEALAVPGGESPGRAFHGNVVISEIVLAQRRPGEQAWRDVPLSWAWADHSQQNLDYEAQLVLDPTPTRGWAADGRDFPGPRTLVVLSEQPFGDAAGAELQLTIRYGSQYAQHSLGHLRVRVAALDDTAALPSSLGRWYRAGPFAVPAGEAIREWAYDQTFGPELAAAFDFDARFGDEQRAWAFDGALADGVVAPLGNTVGIQYAGRTIWSPDARDVEVALGSDDGLQVYLNGELLLEERVDRGAARDQVRTTLPLRAGANLLVLKVVNTGGPSAFAFDVRPAEGVLGGALANALLPADAVTPHAAEALTETWRRQVFDAYRELDDERTAAVAARGELAAAIPRSMVMSERDEVRETFVLSRGEYDKADPTRPVQRDVPAVLSPFPADAPRDRLGFARWLVAADNPLFARVAVNRVWELLFGAGLVRTGDDFGLQGAWPSHPELLDWLAVEFRESGWDLHGLLRLMVSSRTYAQSSAARPELSELDPDDLWLGRYPPRRLQAEAIRDLALFASGLLVERLGGPSVKPYQPDGLWREVAMTQSNTRTFVRDDGDGLWRRSLYTYWKRAVPPPALQTFDAPTRESCVVSRQSTSTPLQALVLWNDEQFVEAARQLAARTLAEPGGDVERLVALMRRCTARSPDAEERALMLAALGDFRARFRDDPDAAEALLGVGEAMGGDDLHAAEHAAWTLLANAVLNLHETITQD